MKRIMIALLCVLVTFIATNNSRSEQSQVSNEDLQSLRKDIEALKSGQTAIQKDLQEIKNLLRARQATPPPEFKEAMINIKDAQVKGSKDAKLVLIEFFDYQ